MNNYHRLLELEKKETLTREETLEKEALEKERASMNDSYYGCYNSTGKNPFRTYYDKEGNPIGLWEWSCLFEDVSYKRIAGKLIGNFFVSTVWLGLNHNFFSGQTPLIFETMVFNEKEDKYRDFECERYATLEEALQGHKEMCEKIRRGKALE